MPKMFPAGTGEKMQYLVHEFNDNTIRFVLRYPGLLQPERLQAAADALVRSTDVLHASFHSGKVGAYWHVHPVWEEHCCFQYVQTAGDPMPAALSLALLPVEPESCTQLRCTLVQSGQESAVVLCISHLCVDGGDGKYLLGKLAQAYQMLSEKGSCEALNVKNGSRATEQVYEGLDGRELRSLMKDPRTGVKSVFPYPAEDAGMLRMVRGRISADVMASARRKAKARGATVNDLLLAACYHAYASVPGVEPHGPMSIMSMMDLRRHCKTRESEGLSNLSGSLPTVLPNGIHEGFEQTLSEIAAQTAKSKEDPLAGLQGMPLLHGATRTLPMGLLLVVASKLYGSMAVGLTNLGNIDCGALSLDGLRPAEGWFAGPVKKKPGMQLSAASFDGACSLCVAGKFTAEDAQVLQQMLDELVRIISEYAQA